ncbi:MAG: CDP-glycerol glycerophosphotransferase family protein [Saccharofermentans sp.]|nr:CDP-glycerol glycerophosphotransferase family protein [Saccharofermentans sp.]
MEFLMVLYIDPGTGGMLFTILFGIFGVAVFSVRALMLKLKYRVSGGKNAKINDQKIPIAIFTDHKRYWNVFEPLLDEFEKRKQKVTYLTCSKDDPVFDKKYEYITGEFIGEGNKAFSKLNLLNASVVISSTPSLDVFQWKRSKNVDYYIHVLHAANEVTLYRMFGTDHYDAILVSGEYQIKQLRQMEELRGIPARETPLCGIPYLDELKKRLDASGPVPAHERTVLLAPSWGAVGTLSRFGEKLLDPLVATGYKIIIRPHPQSYTAEKEMIDHLMSKYGNNPNVEWNRDNDNFEVLRRSDILISDYSGIVFDFTLVFDKPLIYTDTNYDLNPYDASWIEEEPWTFGILPKIGIELNEDNVDKIKDLIDKCIEDPSFGKGRDQARSETWVPMGNGAELAVDFIMKKHDEIAAKKSAEAAAKDNAAKPSKKKLTLSGSKA